jgi:riboflavin synthase
MFTGIVQGVATVRAVEPRGGDVTLVLDTAGISLADIELGGSIAVSGVCLTATRFDAASFAADVSRETLSHTTLGSWVVGSRVNLEKALRAGQALGGHYVTGHVDGVGELVSRYDDARSVRMEFRVPPELARYVARKGSICIDGVSLIFFVMLRRPPRSTQFCTLFPYTTLGGLQAGSRVNLEVDIIARYVERMMHPDLE